MLELISSEKVVLPIPYNENGIKICGVCERPSTSKCDNCRETKIETKLFPSAKKDALKLGLKLKNFIPLREENKCLVFMCARKSSPNPFHFTIFDQLWNSLLQSEW